MHFPAVPNESHAMSSTGLAINPGADDAPDVDPRLARIASDCWKKGNEAIPKENWDYAIQMYGKACELVPHNLAYRQSLIGTVRKKYGDNGRGASMAGMKLMGSRGKLKKSQMSKDWKGMKAACEEGLLVNPWDVSMLVGLGEACASLQYDDVAVFMLEEAIKLEPTNIEANKFLGGVLAEKGEYDRATACWQRVLRVEPLNAEARTKVQELSTNKVIHRGGYESAGTTRQMSTTGKAVSVGDADGPGMSQEADLQRAIRKDPENKDNYLKLGEFYRREGNLAQAEEQLSLAYEKTGGKDHTIRELIEDIHLERMRADLTKAKSDAAQSGDDELKQAASKLAGQLLRQEMEVFKSRVERYPSDMKVKFELGMRYMRIKNWKDAIPLFQQARGDTRIKAESMISLGKCFAYDGKIPLARRQFEAAVGEVNFDDKPDAFKDVHYSLGRLAEEMNDFAVAEEEYQKVIEVDYGFRDCVQRLEAIQARGKDATG
jgi:tetratricopeptide (TPR) repeat protein